MTVTAFVDDLDDLIDAAARLADAATGLGDGRGIDRLIGRLRDSVLRPLRNARSALDSSPVSPAARPDDVAAGDQPAELLSVGDAVWDLAQRATRLISQEGVPLDVREATAALQDLAVGSAAEPAIAAARLARLRELQAALPPAIVPLGGVRETAGGGVAPTSQSATPPDGGPEAIQGALGRALRLRSSTPVQERELVIEHREPLIYMLCAAAELEHALMCEYLFAAFSLKRSVDEGLTEEQLATVERWRSLILLVAKQEMLHLAINCNLVTSLGASPHLSRPNLPQPAKHYPPGVRLALLPFGEQALRHFVYLERPEGMDIDDAEGLEAVVSAVPLMGEEEIAPHLQEFQTVGHLYRSIEAGFRHLSEKLGEERLFLGPAQAQASGDLFGWKELRPIATCDDAVAAIEAIVAQGEGARGDWRNAHFGRFLSVLDEYLDMMEANPGLEVARPVLPVLVRAPETGEDVPVITDPVTARVADICNVGYEVLLQLLYRLMCHVDESDSQIKTLADVSVGIMFDVIEPLAEVLTTMPVGPEYPGRTAGPTFELFYQPDYLLPHRRAAWLLMAEHLEDAAALCDGECSRDARFVAITEALRRYAGALEAGAT